jgi:diguanylate cyclase (GGDEF)-like protein
VKQTGIFGAEETDHDGDLQRLRAALDEINTGVVLLDRDLHPRFVNRAFRQIWHVSDEAVIAGLDFEGLMRIVVGAHSNALTPARFDRFVEERMRLIRIGSDAPRDVRLAGGTVIRVRCQALPDGGRMLLYSDVTDLVQQADRLRELATIDSMTGLYNRRHLLWVGEIEWSRYQRYWRPLSVLMIDIDRFKSINDRFGHLAGDEVIIRVGAVCRDHKRKSDVLARFGGDEFLMLLPETTLDKARQAADRLREQAARQRDRQCRHRGG